MTSAPCVGSHRARRPTFKSSRKYKPPLATRGQSALKEARIAVLVCAPSSMTTSSWSPIWSIQCFSTVRLPGHLLEA